MLRDLGTRLFVIPPALYDNLPDPHPDLASNNTQIVRARIAGENTVNLAITDRRFQQLLGEPSANPLLTAIDGVADLLAVRHTDWSSRVRPMFRNTFRTLYARHVPDLDGSIPRD